CNRVLRKCPAASRRPGRSRSIAKHSPPMLLAHFVGDAGPRQPHQFSKRCLRYCRTQIVKAAAGLFEHDTTSVPRLLVIEIVPCGHVIDAIASPASQAKLQLDESGQLSCLATDKPGPGGP